MDLVLLNQDFTYWCYWTTTSLEPPEVGYHLKRNNTSSIELSTQYNYHPENYYFVELREAGA